MWGRLRWSSPIPHRFSTPAMLALDDCPCHDHKGRLQPDLPGLFWLIGTPRAGAPRASRQTTRCGPAREPATPSASVRSSRPWVPRARAVNGLRVMHRPRQGTVSTMIPLETSNGPELSQATDRRTASTLLPCGSAGSRAGRSCFTSSSSCSPPRVCSQDGGR